jgi:hypothetical protein
VCARPEVHPAFECLFDSALFTGTAGMRCTGGIQTCVSGQSLSEADAPEAFLGHIEGTAFCEACALSTHNPVESVCVQGAAKYQCLRDEKMASTFATVENCRVGIQICNQNTRVASHVASHAAIPPVVSALDAASLQDAETWKYRYCGFCDQSVASQGRTANSVCIQLDQGFDSQTGTVTLGRWKCLWTSHEQSQADEHHCPHGIISCPQEDSTKNAQAARVGYVRGRKIVTRQTAEVGLLFEATRISTHFILSFPAGSTVRIGQHRIIGHAQVPWPRADSRSRRIVRSPGVFPVQCRETAAGHWIGAQIQKHARRHG